MNAFKLFPGFRAERIDTAPGIHTVGEQGVAHRCFDPLKEWREVADDVQGGTLPCGHCIAEEVPEALPERVLPFLDA